MIKSMTAFARAGRVEDTLEILVEIRSYNSRYLDVSLRIPHDYLELEDRIKKEIARFTSRGRVEVTLTIQEGSESAVACRVDRGKARSLHAALVQLKEELGIPGDISLDLVANTGGVLQFQAAEKDMERAWQALQPCLSEALDNLEAMRAAEGHTLERDFILHLDRIETHLAHVQETAATGPSESRARLEERISALISKEMAVDPARIAQEAAFVAVKRDITEEITRAKSHLARFRQVMDAPEPAGKKLNFLLQELNREFNTMSAKAENAGIAHAVVEVKSELEKIREQVLNIE
ncbi:MAG: YicC family protein [Deltaproteobacteria bacterium]|nr:YicC family protein [Deltaproteobacteria bacterium]